MVVLHTQSPLLFKRPCIHWESGVPTSNEDELRTPNKVEGLILSVIAKKYYKLRHDNLIKQEVKFN